MPKFKASERLQVPGRFKFKKITAKVRRLNESREDKQAANETWERGYQRAQQLRQPVVINNRIVVLPSSDEIFVNHNDFTLVVAKDCCVFVLMHRTSGSHGLRITGERFTGQQFWDVNVKPDSQPTDVSLCGADPKCDFYADSFAITDSDLIIGGRYNSGRSFSEPYEWVVPLDQLLAWER